MKKNATYKTLSHSFFKKNYFNLIVGLITTVISSGAMMVVSYGLGAIIDAVGASDMERLKNLAIFVAIAVVIFTLNDLLMCRVRAAFYRRATLQYGKIAFGGIISKGISAFSRESTGTYISLLTNDITSIRTNYLMNIFDLCGQIVMLVGALVMMLVYSRWLTLVAAGFSLLPIVIALLMSGQLAKREKTVSDFNEIFVRVLKDILSGFAIIKSFKSEKQTENRFNETNKTKEKAIFRRYWWSSMLSTFTTVGGVIMQFGVFFIGALLAIKGQITAGTILVFVNLCNCFISPIQNIPQFTGQIRAAKALVKKLADTLDANPERSGDEIEPVLTDGIELKNIKFAYEEDKPVLNDISLKLESGKKYAVVGNSGSGKSTLLNLLMGAYENYEGEINFDGKELRTIAPNSLYDLVSMISQNVILFDDNIQENVTMFGEYDKADVDEALERAGLSKLIEEKGNDYSCGENGVNLSGGEKQRISIARCLLRKTPVLLLDEATAALDNKTSFEIVNAILGLDELTRLVVTHKLEEALLKQYDCIFVLWNGSVVESGTFDCLMEQKGRFYSLYTLRE